MSDPGIAQWVRCPHVDATNGPVLCAVALLLVCCVCLRQCVCMGHECSCLRRLQG